MIADFRTIYGVSVYAVPMHEVWPLLLKLLANPESWLQAAFNNWAHPFSRDGIALADLYDLQHQSKSKKKVKPYPRPWGDGSKKKIGTAVTAVEAVALLRPTV